MKSRLSLFVLPAFLLLLTVLTIYSYAHIDLNLTLSSNVFYQKIQQSLIQLGYFNRQASTAVYLFIITALFLFQIYFLVEAKSKKLSANSILKLSLSLAAILVFSYPAFSHDIFNYIFDARLVVKHQVNPWQFTALDFPYDLWTRFMHWTHRTYPYGPFWLVLTVAVYLVGLGKFTLTLLWFKLLGAVSYLASVVTVRNILKKILPEKVSVGMILFALNPLIIIESLVNAHLDIVMTAFMLLAIYWAIEKKKILSWLTLLASVAIKFITVVVAPVIYCWKGKKQYFSKAITQMLILSSLATVVVIIFREPLPWYFITPLALVSLLPQKQTLSSLAIVLSLGLLLRYAPFLLKGEYSEWVIVTSNLLTITPFLLAGVLVLLKKRLNFSDSI